MSSVKFLEVVPAGDPLNRPCTILGKKTNLKLVDYDKVQPYFGDKVNKEVTARLLLKACIIIAVVQLAWIT